MCRNVLLKFFFEFLGSFTKLIYDITKFLLQNVLYRTLVKSAFVINPFPTNAPFMNKPGSWFLLAKYVKNTCGIKTF